MKEIPAKILLTDDEFKKYKNNELDLSKAILRDNKIRAHVPLEINYETDDDQENESIRENAQSVPESNNSIESNKNIDGNALSPFLYIVPSIVATGALVFTHLKTRQQKKVENFQIKLNQYLDALLNDNVDNKVIDELNDSIEIIKKDKLMRWSKISSSIQQTVENIYKLSEKSSKVSPKENKLKMPNDSLKDNVIQLQAYLEKERKELVKVQ
ncbi:hypothetical protein [Streptococcus pluranimalium]|uniref:hypothetical protein n=1 Tax=Streptococcus pluranimalium TaxID=82348 RepID=UPI003BF90291